MPIVALGAFLPKTNNIMRKPLLFFFFLSTLSVWAQGPNDTGTYYQAADGKKGEELKTALFTIISPHTILKYTYDVWDAIESYDQLMDELFQQQIKNRKGNLVDFSKLGYSLETVISSIDV